MRIFASAVLAAGVIAGLATAPVAGAQTACADLGGSVDAEKICSVHVENPIYRLDYTFPDDYPDQQALTAYLTQTRDGFVNVAETPGSWNLPYVLDAKGTSYRSGPDNAGTRSVVFEVYENVGGAHPQTWYKAFNWDVVKKAPVTTFAHGPSPRRPVFRSIGTSVTPGGTSNSRGAPRSFASSTRFTKSSQIGRATSPPVDPDPSDFAGSS